MWIFFPCGVKQSQEMSKVILQMHAEKQMWRMKRKKTPGGLRTKVVKGKQGDLKKMWRKRFFFCFFLLDKNYCGRCHPLPKKQKVTSHRKLHWQHCCLAPCTPAQIKVQRGCGQREQSWLWPLTRTDDSYSLIGVQDFLYANLGAPQLTQSFFVFIKHSVVCLF